MRFLEAKIDAFLSLPLWFTVTNFMRMLNNPYKQRFFELYPPKSVFTPKNENLYLTWAINGTFIAGDRLKWA